MSPEPSTRPGACERCHRRKARCDKTRPACSSCIKANKACIYTAKEGTIRRQDLERVQQRVRQLEARNKDLVNQLSRSQNQPSPENPPPMSVDSALNTSGSSGEVVNQVSYLSLSAGGDRQFLGSTSGLLLANLLQKNLQTSFPLIANSEVRAHEQRPALGKGAAPAAHASSRPPQDVARGLLIAYCNHDHICYPFLDPKTLHAALEAIYSEESYSVYHPVESFFIDMILAIGTAQVYKFDWLNLPDAETHYNRAITHLPVVLGAGGILSLQATLLIAQYRMGSSLYDTSASLWHLVGVAARMCFELGLHKKSTYVLPQSGNVPAEQVQREKMEMMRRCFWCVVAMDRIVSFTLGRPLAVQLDDVDAELPQLDATDATETANGAFSDDSIEAPLSDQRLALFNHIVRYRLICGKILISLHRDTRPVGTTIDYFKIREELSHELRTWHRETSALPFLALDAILDPPNTSSFRSREWYDLLYHNGILMLFRPSPTLSDASSNSVTLQHIFESSQAAINLYAELHRSRKINYSWVTLHAVFMAGISYIYALRCHVQNTWRQPSPTNYPRAKLHSSPTIQKVVNDTRACSNVLVAVSERWSTARSCSRVFDRLSDAVLADIIETQTRKPATPIVEPIHQQRMENVPILGSAISMDLPTPDNDQTWAASFSHMAVDSTLQDCFDDLQSWCNDQYGGDAIAQLSQNWLFGIQDPSSAAF
ncbi:putative Fungal specific transcription factor [Fonsecaea pedrosoi]|nr:putative Fungal specific transcription factor [Fonsecaea pedrosoi]